MKKLTAWDCKIAMWEKWESFYEQDKSQYQDLTWDTFKLMFKDRFEEWQIDMGLEKFRFELDYVYREPNSKTMQYLFGEHAMLYDTYGCSKHRFICTTHDDYPRYVHGMTVFCPECNSSLFLKDEHRKSYEQVVEGQYLDEEQWKKIMRLSKWHRKFNRQQNFKYKLEQWSKPAYIQYRIKRALGFYNKKES